MRRAQRAGGPRDRVPARSSVLSADISARRHVARVPRCGVFSFLVIQNETVHASKQCMRLRASLTTFSYIFLMFQNDGFLPFLPHVFPCFLFLHSALFRLVFFYFPVLSSSTTTFSCFILSSFLCFSSVVFSLFPILTSSFIFLLLLFLFPLEQHDSRLVDHRRSNNRGGAESPVRIAPRAISGTPTI